MKKLLPLLVLLLFVFSCKDREIDLRPTADFTFKDTTNGTVVFSGMSKNAISYIWSFSDGFGSVEPSPTHRYRSNGEFTVTLTVKNSKGESDQISKNVSVRSVP